MSSIDGFSVTEIQISENQNISRSIESVDGDDSLRFIFVPLAVLIGIMILSALVYLMARSRRKLVKIYEYVHSPKRTQNGPWDIEDNDDPTECLLSGKLQIDNRYDKCQSRKSELYT